MFLCLLVFQLRARRHVVAACIAGALAVVLSLIFSGNGYIIVATVVAATVVTFVNRHAKGSDDDRGPEGTKTHEPGN